MSTSYHTTNSLLNVKMQSGGMTFSPVWEPKRSPGERCSSAQQYEPMKECVSFFSSETRPAFPLCVWEGCCFIHKIHKCVFLPVALIDTKTARKKKNHWIRKRSARSHWECGTGSSMGHSSVKRWWDSKEERLVNVMYYSPYPSIIHPSSSAMFKKCILTDG